jgi:NAD(P)-dependent dehydrogenase (short-subunit alcohol dehydrogenase family)
MVEDVKYEPRIALVTGATRGIGHEIAEQLAMVGMTVLLGARDRQRGAEVAAALRSNGGDVRSILLDVTEPSTVHNAAEHINEWYGRLDVLVNNAGITSTHGQQPAAVDLDVIRTIFETNVFGVITVTSAMLPLLMLSPAARVVNMSSSVGSLTAQSDAGSPLARIAASVGYPVSKTALNALTVQYAKEWIQTNILVNAVDPGGAATDLTKSLGYEFTRTPAQGAAIAVHLATVGADGPTGGFFNDAGPIPW